MRRKLQVAGILKRVEVLHAGKEAARAARVDGLIVGAGPAQRVDGVSERVGGHGRIVWCLGNCGARKGRRIGARSGKRAAKAASDATANKRSVMGEGQIYKGPRPRPEEASMAFLEQGRSLPGVRKSPRS